MSIEDIRRAIHSHHVTDEELKIWFDKKPEYISPEIFAAITLSKRLKLLHYMINQHPRKQVCHHNALRSAIQGRAVTSAVRLVQWGVNVQESLIQQDERIITDEKGCEVYVWGTNANYTLGLGHGNPRAVPEPIDYFNQRNILIKQVSLSPFHSVYLSTDNCAYACGIQGSGRLSLSTAAFLLPHPMTTAGEVRCVSTAIDHTVVVTQAGSAYTCGDNTRRVLGHADQPQGGSTLRRVSGLRGLVGARAARGHTVVWSDHKLWVWGENIGQMGFNVEGNVVVTPQEISCIRMDNKSIADVFATNSSTLVFCTDGHLYLLHQYRCTRLTKKYMLYEERPIKPQIVENMAGDLKILAINADGRLLIWHHAKSENYCSIGLPIRDSSPVDLAATWSTILVATENGAAYQFELVHEKDSVSCQVDKWRRVVHIYRAAAVACDSVQGSSWAILQWPLQPSLTELPDDLGSAFADDMKSLLGNASEEDFLHDIVFALDACRIPAHKSVIDRAKFLFQDCLSREFRIVKVTKETFWNLLLVIYTGTIPPHVDRQKVVYNGWSLERVLNNLNSFDFLNCDIKIICGDGVEIAAHRAVLAARSSYFQAMLMHPWKECTKELYKISVRHIRGCIMQKLVDFLYQDEVDPHLMTFDDQIELFIAADSLLLTGLKAKLEMHFSKRLPVRGRLAELILLSVQYHGDFLFKMVRNFIRNNLPAILDARSLQSLPDNILEKFDDCGKENLEISDLLLAQIRSFAESEKMSATLDSSPETKRHKNSPKKPRRKTLESESNLTTGESPANAPKDDIFVPKAIIQLEKLEISEEDFPHLASTSQQHRPRPKSFNTTRIKVPSQSQRKRLLSENATSPPKERMTWQETAKESNSLEAIMQGELVLRRAAVWQQRKPLEMTQLEERAMRELRIFYGADSAVDELITVSRASKVSGMVVRQGVWVSGRV